MLHYVDCNIQTYILYVINANSTILYYTLYMILFVCTSLHKAFVFFYEALYHKSFFSVCCSSYTFCFDGILVVYLYYIAKYMVFN